MATMAFRGKTPQVAIAVDIDEVFFHCAKAFKRSNLWKPESWRDSSDMPTLAEIIVDQLQMKDTTVEQLAASAAKNHSHGALNPSAQYQKVMSVAEVLADKVVLAPLTRAMCSPISDGAAAVMLCSGEALKTLAPAVHARAVKVLGLELASGQYRSLSEAAVAQGCATRLYRRTGVTPTQVQLAEVHDATSFAEVSAVEALGFCSTGKGGPYVASGACSQGGERPINLSGGLVSKGHPVAASGLAMVHELTTQLRGEAGPRQARGVKVGLWHNAGGLTGFDEAACAVGLLQAPP